MKHLETDHKLALLDGDINIKMHGNFICECGHRFHSEMVTVIYKNKNVYLLTMKCALCHNSCRPTILFRRKALDIETIAIHARWKLTQRSIPNTSVNRYFKKKVLDHQEDLCESCSLGLCRGNKVPDWPMNEGFLAKAFINAKHQILETSNRFDMLSIDDTIKSNQP
jgi:hypothetical protein